MSRAGGGNVEPNDVAASGKVRQPTAFACSGEPASFAVEMTRPFCTIGS